MDAKLSVFTCIGWSYFIKYAQSENFKGQVLITFQCHNFPLSSYNFPFKCYYFISISKTSIKYLNINYVL